MGSIMKKKSLVISERMLNSAKEMLETYGILSPYMLRRKLWIEYDLAELIYHELVKPIKIIDPDKCHIYHSPTIKFWKSRQDWII